MFYFIYGNSPTVEFESEKIIEKINAENPKIVPKIFDCSLKEEELFIEAIQINSIFLTIDFLILKRAEFLKNIGIQKLIKSMKTYNLNQKNIVIIYDTPIQFGKVVTEYELTKTTIKSIEEIATFKNFVSITSENLVLEYIKKKLIISDNEAKELSEILGEDYFNIKNEVDKISIFLDGENYSIEKVKNLINVDKEYSIKELIENFLKEKNFENIINFLKSNKDMYLTFIYNFSEELITMLKISSLISDGKFSKNINYNVFKEIFSEISDNFLGRNFKPVHPYTIFLKLNNFSILDDNVIKEKLKELLYMEYNMKNGNREIETDLELFFKNFFD